MPWTSSRLQSIQWVSRQYSTIYPHTFNNSPALYHRRLLAVFLCAFYPAPNRHNFGWLFNGAYTYIHIYLCVCVWSVLFSIFWSFSLFRCAAGVLIDIISKCIAKTEGGGRRKCLNFRSVKVYFMCNVICICVNRRKYSLHKIERVVLLGVWMGFDLS